jgi:hypothetical protein
VARATFFPMKWFRGPWVTCALMGAGLLTAGCAGVVGASAAVVVVGAGVLTMTCYDRVSVTVTDQLTGTKLCDAKVTFIEGGSETEATSCYEAALSNGQYKMRVERPGLVPYEVPLHIDTGKSCKHAIQTLWVALDRPNMQQPPQQLAPPPPPIAPAPAAPSAPASAPVPDPAPSAAPAPAAPVPAPSGSSVTPAPSAASPASPATPPSAVPPPPAAPSAGTLPDAP